MYDVANAIRNFSIGQDGSSVVLDIGVAANCDKFHNYITSMPQPKITMRGSRRADS
jgi:hypothetical protein